MKLILRIFFFITVLVMFSACNENIISDIETEHNEIYDKTKLGHLSLTRSEIEESKDVDYILKDDIADEELYNNNKTYFIINRPIQVIIDEQTLSLKFYSARKVNGVKIWAHLDSYPEDFLLAEFEELPPFISYKKLLPMISKDAEYITRTGKKIIFVKNPYISASDLDLSIECEDPYYKMVTGIPSNTKVCFSKYSGTGSWTNKILPVHCRESVAMMTNMMYMFTTDYFKEEFDKRHYYTDAQKTKEVSHEVLRNKLLNVNGGNKIIFGHTITVNGLGGGATLGLNEWCFLEHYPDDKSETHAFFHEYGHCLGYGHSGNMTYDDGTGFNSLCIKVYRELCLQKKLPVYSRRFLNSRSTSKTYGSAKHQPSKYIIEDPELDLIDGGITIPGVTNPVNDVSVGSPINVSVSWQDIPTIDVSAKFKPVDVCYANGKLYVLNAASGNQSVEMFTVNGNSILHQKSLRNWTFKGSERSFAGVVQAISVGNGKVFINEQDSRTDVFDSNLNYIVSIGNGNWGNALNQTIHAFDTYIQGDLVFIKDKKKICIYKDADIVAGNDAQIFRYAQTKEHSEVSSAYGMTMDKNKILYSTTNSTKIQCFDFSQKFYEFETINSIRDITIVQRPYSLACVGDFLFVTTYHNDYRLLKINKLTGEIEKNYKEYLKTKNVAQISKMEISEGNVWLVDSQLHKVISIPINEFLNQ